MSLNNSKRKEQYDLIVKLQNLQTDHELGQFNLQEQQKAHEEQQKAHEELQKAQEELKKQVADLRTQLNDQSASSTPPDQDVDMSSGNDWNDGNDWNNSEWISGNDWNNEHYN